MSDYKEHAIMISGYDGAEEYMTKDHEKAVELFGHLVTPMMDDVVNGLRTFVVVPTGSKINRDESNKHEDSCKKFVEFLKTECTFLDGEPRLSWVEVTYGEREYHGASEILNDSYYSPY